MMRRVLFLIICFVFLSLSTLAAQQLPKPVGYVNDFAGVIDQNSKARMDSLIRILKEKTGVELAVVTVDTIAPSASIEDYSIRLAEQWGIGKKGEDTGILLLLAMGERRVRIEVGYGLEGIIPDGLAGEIIDRSILPDLRGGNYGAGLLKGVQAVAGIVARASGVELDSSSVSESRRYTDSGRSGLGGLSTIIFIILFFFIFGGMRFLWPLIFLGGISRRGFYGGGFGSGRSGHGGGFSGFGGGGFGGGGASRGF